MAIEVTQLFRVLYQLKWNMFSALGTSMPCSTATLIEFFIQKPGMTCSCGFRNGSCYTFCCWRIRGQFVSITGVGGAAAAGGVIARRAGWVQK